MKINKTIFREYDIRGVAGNKFDKKLVAEYEKWYGKFPGVTLDLDAATAIGKAYGTIIAQNKGTKVIVGYEKRPFGDKLKKAFIDGILTTGVSVIDGDILLTPMVYFFIPHLHLDGGVNITGSHNVYFYNGFKMMKRGCRPLYGKELQKMHRMVEAENFFVAKKPGLIGKVPHLTDIYLKYLLAHTKLKKKIHVSVDCGNGSAGMFAKEYLTKLGCEVKGIYMNVDTTFPNHIPDPEPPQNLRDLQKQVLKNKSDIGIAFDADCDRAGYVDEKGQIVTPDDILLILAKDVLKRHPGKKILYDVKSTALFETLIPEYGGIPMMHCTGHAPIKETMKTDLDVILGGEVSGHQFFAEDYYRHDDGMWSAAKILELLSKQDKTLSEIIAKLPRPVRTPEIKLPTTDDVKFTVVKKVTASFLKKYKVITIDGSRIIFSDTSWGLVRASNTSPYLTVRFEAPTEKELIRIKNLVADVLDKQPEIKDKLDRTKVASLTGILGWL